MFNFDNGVSGKPTVSTVLAPNQIHLVNFKGAEAIEKEGKDGAKYNVLTFKWENESGSYTDTLFEPRPEDFEEQDNGFGGKNPSGADQIIARIKHNIATLNPTLYAEMEATKKNFRSWDELRKYTVAAVNTAIDKQTNIKLLKNKTGLATMPTHPLSYNKAGEKYMSTSFIGDQIKFTTKELNKMEANANATATTMATATGIPSLAGDAKSASADLDFDPTKL